MLRAMNHHRISPGVTAATSPGSRAVWLHAAQVLTRYGISRATLERRVKDKSFPVPVRLGGSRRWSLAELERFDARLLADRGVSP
jgi:predicted DNA-binding transcriptional regulator AlpA